MVAPVLVILGYSLHVYMSQFPQDAREQILLNVVITVSTALAYLGDRGKPLQQQSIHFPLLVPFHYSQMPQHLEQHWRKDNRTLIIK